MGHGIETWEGGSFVGSYKNDQKNGKGEEKWASGGYFGNFKNDLRDGNGTLVLVNG